MIQVFLVKDDNLWTKLEVTGHADYADYGKDIVCAGISTAVLMSINLLERIIPNCFDLIQNEKKGYISLTHLQYNNLEKETISFVNTIFENLKDTLLDFQASYPNNLLIKIENK